MMEDKEGFLYPQVDKDKCIDCHLCEKVCPIKNRDISTESILGVYGAYAKDSKLREESSSGGIFSLLAERVLDLGGSVYGAAFDSEYVITHIAIKDKSELYKLRGSKYAQSRIVHVFCEIKKELKEGRFVLFSGTECQVSGLKNYLGKEYKNLYTVDVLCHGTPSPKLWKKYLNEKSKAVLQNKIPNQVHFRSKISGWEHYSLQMGSYHCEFRKDPYMRLFLANICLRPSCHDCQFKSFPRKSDITLGDFWGVAQVIPELYDDKGTSVIIVNSVRGEGLLKQVESQMNICKIELDRALPPSADSRKSVLAHKKRKKFFEVLDRWSVEQLLKLLEPSITNRIIRKIKRIAGKR